MTRTRALLRRPASCLALCCVLSTLSVIAESVTTAIGVHADDFVFGFYPNGWRGRSADGDIVFAIHASNYALTLNASKARIDASTQISPAVSSTVAATQSKALIAGLSSNPLTFQVKVGDVVYDAVSAAPKPDAVVIQRMGKYLVHIELRDVLLQAKDGSQPAGVRAKLHLYAWPNRAHVSCEVLRDAAASSITAIASYPNSASDALAISNEISSQELSSDGLNTTISASTSNVESGAAIRVTAVLAPKLGECKPEPTVRAQGIVPYTQELSVTTDPVAGWQQVSLGDNPDIWTMERVRVELANPSEQSTTLRLAFSKRGGGFGVTGMSPVLCDSDGAPLGIPVQISKNWHVSPAWFDGITMLYLQPNETRTLEFRLAYANWGTLPAVAHAQLCLEGWGTNQLWDQMAIGSFGESICYDPDVNLNRSMIDDIRPLMVWGMGEQPQRKWSWTHNVGGGDFLVVEQNGERQYLVQQKTDYVAQGPVLTNVTYSGETPDGAIQSKITTQTWRADDYVRALDTLEYHVSKPTTASRIAFFQLGADRYNHNLFAQIARGNAGGMLESWQSEMGGKRYSRERLPFEGDKPWLALYGAQKNPPPVIKEGDLGAWANRGMIVHSWKARIGGDDVPLPHYSVYGTDDGNIPSAVVELSPPPGVTEFLAGDYVSAVVEMVILPQRAEDYYGPNEKMRTFLAAHPDDWAMVHREAVASQVRVAADAGKVISEWPIVVEADSTSEARFTVEGGTGHGPVTITNVKWHAPFHVEMTNGSETKRVDDSSPAGNDWWQTLYHPETNTYDIVFTMNLDSLKTDGKRMVSFSQR